MSKTVNTLKEAQVIVNGEIVETVEMKNPCQMWKKVDELFLNYGIGAEVKVLREDGTLYKDFSLVTLKNGKTQKVNSVKETNRWMMMKAKKAADEKAAKEAERKAKKAAYDRERRARLKAAKEAAKVQEAAEVKEAI